MFSEAAYWIGLYSYAYKNQFKWIETDSDLEFKDIHGDFLRESNLAVNGCVKVGFANGRTYRWIDDLCYTHSGSVCQIQ